MAESNLFNEQQHRWVGEALDRAETLAEGYFQVDLKNSARFLYDLKTRVHLKGLEKTRRALAQVCKYEYYNRFSAEEPKGKEFYRICLQDNRILNTVDDPTLLKPLLLYVITHEIIHVIRFTIDPKRFYLNFKERKVEEKEVHQATYELLRPVKDPHLDLLLERYRSIWEWPNELDPKRQVLDNLQNNA
jgi:hypothetical protein